MFEKSEYGFNYFCILDFNYGEIPIENIVVRNQIQCFEFNSMSINNITLSFSPYYRALSYKYVYM